MNMWFGETFSGGNNDASCKTNCCNILTSRADDGGGNNQRCGSDRYSDGESGRRIWRNQWRDYHVSVTHRTTDDTSRRPVAWTTNAAEMNINDTGGLQLVSNDHRSGRSNAGACHACNLPQLKQWMEWWIRSDKNWVNDDSSLTLSSFLEAVLSPKQQTVLNIMTIIIMHDVRHERQRSS